MSRGLCEKNVNFLCPPDPPHDSLDPVCSLFVSYAVSREAGLKNNQSHRPKQKARDAE